MKHSCTYFKLADPTNHYGVCGTYESREDAEAAIPEIHARQQAQGYKPDPLVIIKVEWETNYDDFGTFISRTTKETRV